MGGKLQITFGHIHVYRPYYVGSNTVCPDYIFLLLMFFFQNLKYNLEKTEQQVIKFGILHRNDHIIFFFHLGHTLSKQTSFYTFRK